MRRWLLPLFALTAGLTGPASGQDRVFRIGVLFPTGEASTSVAATTVPELAALGFVEGRNLVLDYRNAGGELDRLPALAHELVREAPDVIIAGGPPAIRATRQATGSDGKVYNLGNGIIRASSQESLERRTLIEPGKVYEYKIDLWPTSNLFRPGHRIGLEISSSNFPHYDRNPNTGAEFGQETTFKIADQTILHDADHPSRITLPVIPTPIQTSTTAAR